MSPIRLGTSTGNWDPVPWPNFRWFFGVGVGFISKTLWKSGCGIADPSDPSPWYFPFIIFTEVNLAVLQVKIPNQILSSVSPSKSTLSFDFHSICFIYRNLIYCYYYGSCSKNFPTSFDMNVASILPSSCGLNVVYKICNKKERKRNSCLRIWKSFY